MTSLFTAAQILTADNLNSMIATAYRTSDATVRTSTTLTADDQLVVPVEASSVYFLIGYYAWAGTDTTSDIVFDYTGPTGADIPKQSLVAPGTSASGTVESLDVGIANAIGSNRTRGAINGSLSGLALGYVTVDTTAGDITLRWAPNASANGVQLLTGSWIMLFKVS